MEEEKDSYEYDHDISTIEHTLFSYLHKLKLGTETFFISVVSKRNQKDTFLENFPKFVEELSVILKQLI